MGKAVKWGHHTPYAKDAAKTSASGQNIPRPRQKISKGFSSGLGVELSPANMPVGGVFTLSDQDAINYNSSGEMGRSFNAWLDFGLDGGNTYRAEQWLHAEKVKIGGKYVNAEICVTFFRATYLAPLNRLDYLVPRSYEVKHDGVTVEYLHHAQ